MTKEEIIKRQYEISGELMKCGRSLTNLAENLFRCGFENLSTEIKEYGNVILSVQGELGKLEGRKVVLELHKSEKELGETVKMVLGSAFKMKESEEQNDNSQ